MYFVLCTSSYSGSLRVNNLTLYIKCKSFATIQMPLQNLLHTDLLKKCLMSYALYHIHLNRLSPKITLINYRYIGELERRNIIYSCFYNFFFVFLYPYRSRFSSNIIVLQSKDIFSHLL